MIKKSLFIAMLITLLIVFSHTAMEAKENLDTHSKNFYIQNTYKDTGSKNIVTGIYLDYRLFDSIFEAGILIIAVAGIIFMAKSDKEIT